MQMMNDRPIQEIAEIIFNMDADRVARAAKLSNLSDYSSDSKIAVRRRIEAINDEKSIDSGKCSINLTESRSYIPNSAQRRGIQQFKERYNFGAQKRK